MWSLCHCTVSCNLTSSCRFSLPVLPLLGKQKHLNLVSVELCDCPTDTKTLFPPVLLPTISPPLSLCEKSFREWGLARVLDIGVVSSMQMKRCPSLDTVKDSINTYPDQSMVSPWLLGVWLLRYLNKQVNKWNKPEVLNFRNPCMLSISTGAIPSLGMSNSAKIFL